MDVRVAADLLRHQLRGHEPIVKLTGARASASARAITQTQQAGVVCG